MQSAITAHDQQTVSVFTIAVTSCILYQLLCIQYSVLCYMNCLAHTEYLGCDPDFINTYSMCDNNLRVSAMLQ